MFFLSQDKKSLSIAIFEWFLAFLFLFLCGLDLFIEGNAWPSIVSVLVVAASEAVFLPWFVQAAGARARTDVRRGNPPVRVK
jgi:hypothetical protein